jgi:hypothetical protein
MSFSRGVNLEPQVAPQVRSSELTVILSLSEFLLERRGSGKVSAEKPTGKPEVLFLVSHLLCYRFTGNPLIKDS